MKRIAVLTCLERSKMCIGGGCFEAINRRKGTFETYVYDTVEIVSFFHCNGCACDTEHDAAYKEKIKRVITLKPDAIHVGVCTIKQLKECPTITEMVSLFEAEGIKVIRGTH